MAFKAYTRKYSALIGAKRAGLGEDAVFMHNGQWGFMEPGTTLSQAVSSPAPAPAARPLPRLNTPGGALTSSFRGHVNFADIGGTSADDGSYDEPAPKQRKPREPRDPVKKLGDSTVKALGKVNKNLDEIRKLIFTENKREENKDKRDKLNNLEEEREKKDPKSGGGLFSKFAEKTSGFMNVLKALSLPLILGGLLELNKDFGLFKKARETVTKWAVKLQGFFDQLADIPLFKGNIVGLAIKNLLPIMAGFGVLAAFKPGIAFKMLKGVAKFFKFFGSNPEINGLEKLGSLFGDGAEAAKTLGKFGKFLGFFGKILGKIFLPLTIIMTLWDTVKGAMDGYKTGGALGAFKGAIDGLVHGLIGGLIDTVVHGIGWILEQFGVDASRFKNFSFGKFLDELGSNIGMFVFDVVDEIKKTFTQALEGIGKILTSDEGIMQKMIDLFMFPGKLVMQKFQEYFGGLSPMAALQKIWSFITGNHAISNALDSASKPDGSHASPKPIIIDPSNPASMQKAPPARAVASNDGMASRMAGRNTQTLEQQARKAGLSDQQIAYAYETDKMLGAPRGTTLAQLKQESHFNSTARSGTGAVGLAQFTSIAVKDVLATQRGVDPSKISKDEVAKVKASLNGDNDKSLEFHRQLMLNIKKRHGGDWKGVLRDYNGDTKLEKNGLQARDNYIQRITANLGTPIDQGRTAAALVAKTEDASDSVMKKSSGSAVVAPINNSRVAVNNQTTNQLPNMSASTPVEFAPHVT